MFGLGKKKDQPEPSGGGGWQQLVERFMLQPHPKGGYINTPPDEAVKSAVPLPSGLTE